MANLLNEKDMLLQNLQDAGCDHDMIACCMQLAEQNSEVRMLPELQKFRGCLLEAMHQEQRKLECLDYLIYQLKKQNRK
ncbi:MAG: hypothetical protein Q4B09_02525 [Lachnospiraceae bacterium]|nr:hypothetical protein [Lachnospiraceae bacterium]